MNNIPTRPCECEHVAHFHDSSEQELTPNGNHGHKYGVRFAEHFITPVRTVMGTFNVCKDCAGDCYAEMRIEREY